ncbi:hypothetical protein AB1Y20_007353 [Prymnesium parvum]|uniref:Major facilitator superfamily (MFS) profile domain-containing protein n=1 Tax=Prymnesium parvum TaxID=97485 RepID=A0AB34IXB8_PRYPA
MRGAPQAIRRFSAARAMLYAALGYASCRILMATLALVHDPRRLALYTTLILAVQSFADATCDVAASTTVLLSVPREERTQAQGTFLALRSIGSLVAPPIGGWLFVKGGFALPFLSFGFMLFIACLPVARVVLAAPGVRASTQDEDGSGDSFILQVPAVRRTFVTMTTLAACMSLPTSYWSPYLNSPPFLLDEARIGVITMIATVCFTISSIMAGSIEKLLGGKAMLSIGCCIAALGSCFISPVYPFCLLPCTISVAAISMCVKFAGIGLVFAAASPLCVRLAEQAGFEEEKATVQTTSLWVLAFAIAGTAAPPIGGWLADRLGARWTNFICGSFALLATAPLLGPLGMVEQQTSSAEAGKIFMGKV